METEVNHLNGIRALKISGHVAAPDVSELIEKLGQLKETPGARCILDTSLLKNLPTAVIGALIDLIRHLEGSGGRLVLAAPAATVRVPLDRLGITPMVRISESLDEAVEILTKDDRED